MLRYLAVACCLLAGLSSSAVHAQTASPRARLQAMALETATVGRVTAYFTPTDRAYAERLAALSEHAAAFYERELGAAFPLHLAVLGPKDWFVPYAGGDNEPYGMPWGWVEESLMTAPASLTQGVLIAGPDSQSNARRVQFVLLHEFGHLANKRYLHPESAHAYSSVRWFEELLATYFAYAYVRAHDPAWASTSRREWTDFVAGYQPSVVSLDWRFLRDLAPEEFGRTYAWYQNLLNLRAAEMYEAHGLSLLRELRRELPWATANEWTTESLLTGLERVAPGMQMWADSLAARGSPG